MLAKSKHKSLQVTEHHTQPHRLSALWAGSLSGLLWPETFANDRFQVNEGDDARRKLGGWTRWKFYALSGIPDHLLAMAIASETRLRRADEEKLRVGVLPLAVAVLGWSRARRLREVCDGGGWLRR